MAKSARKELIAFLRNVVHRVDSSEVVAAIEAAGYRKQVGYQALSAAVKDGEVTRHGDGRPYTYSLAAEKSDAEAPASPTGAVPFAASLGVACATPLLADSHGDAKPSGSAADMNAELVVGAFDAEVAMTRKDVVQALEGKLSPPQVAEAMNELIHAGRMLSRFDREEGASIYWIVEPDAEPSVAATPTPEPAAEPPLAEIAPAATSAVTPVPELPKAPSPTAAPKALTDRVDAIATDLEDAIGDACDARLPHALIKVLTIASGAAHRAARELRVV